MQINEADYLGIEQSIEQFCTDVEYLVTVQRLKHESARREATESSLQHGRLEHDLHFRQPNIETARFQAMLF